MDYAKESLKLHAEKRGKIEVISKVKVENKEDSTQKNTSKENQVETNKVSDSLVKYLEFKS